MNTKTTIMLAVVLVGLGLGYLWRPVKKAATTTTPTPSALSGNQISKKVIDPALGDIVKIDCQRHDAKEPWIFQQSKDGNGVAQWKLTAPIKAKAVRWEVDRIARQLTDLKYEIVYHANTDGAILADQAGLNPPFATVTLTDNKGSSVTIEIGGPQSISTIYVRLAGLDDIYVATTSLGNMIKKRAIDYRDQQLWAFEPSKAVRIEITDNADAKHPVEYAFVKHGSGWQMEKPAAAKATSKVTDMLTAMARIRMASWVDNRSDRLSGFGLAQAALTARVTVLEEAPVSEDSQADASQAKETGEQTEDHAGLKTEEPNAPPKTKSQEKTYVLHLSSQSPIGEDSRVYARAGDESAVGSILKTTADKFKPVINQWRDMQITDAETIRATRIELSSRQGDATFVKRDGGWWFEADSKKADDREIFSLLTAIASLEAVAFVDRQAGDSIDYGFTEPQARYLLTLPDQADPEKITVGNFTNESTKRLVYVMHNDQASVGKVRTLDVEMMTRGPKDYLDKSIVRLADSQIIGLSLSCENPYTDSRRDVTFSRSGNDWRMTKPIEADLQKNKVTDLIHALADLTAQAVVGDASQLSAFGLHAPAATVTIRYEISDNDAETIDLAFSDHDGQIYVKRADRDDIFQVETFLLDQLKGEFRLEDVLTFDESKVASFVVSTSGVENRFARNDDKGWVYSSEPDLPLDNAKVDALLLRFKDLKTKRYATYNVSDLAKFGLEAPAHRVTISLENGTSMALDIASKATTTTADPGFADPNSTNPNSIDRGYFARIEGSNDVFILPPDTSNRIKVDLAELEPS